MYKYTTKNINSLIPYLNNARTHSEEQINQIASSIKEFKFTNPILIDEHGGIIAGHGRLLAAKKLNIEEIPCIILDSLTEAQKKAYVLADNQLGLNAGWDIEKLKLEIDNLQELNFDIDLIGFDDEFLDIILKNDEINEEDDFIEEPTKSISVNGDIWILDNHRLMCGDSTNINDVKNLMNGNKADMVFTDPPYNTGMKAKSNPKDRLNHMFNDSFEQKEWIDFIKNFCNIYDIYTKEDVFIFIFLDWRRSHELVPQIKNIWKFSNLIVWDKEIHGLGKSDYSFAHEFIHVCKKGNPPHAKNKNGEKEYYDIWHIQRKHSSSDHATKKPIEICERAILHTTKHKNIVLDLFCGSGSTLIACEKNNRYCYTSEINPIYVDCTIKRWQKFTGKNAIHIKTGKTYNEIIYENI